MNAEEWRVKLEAVARSRQMLLYQKAAAMKTFNEKLSACERDVKDVLAALDEIDKPLPLFPDEVPVLGSPVPGADPPPSSSETPPTSLAETPAETPAGGGGARARARTSSRIGDATIQSDAPVPDAPAPGHGPDGPEPGLFDQAYERRMVDRVDHLTPEGKKRIIKKGGKET